MNDLLEESFMRWLQSLHLILLGSFLSCVVHDHIILHSCPNFPLKSLFLYFRWMTCIQFLCQIWAYWDWCSENYSAYPAFLGLVLTGLFSCLISSATIVEARALKIAVLGIVEWKEDMDPSLTTCIESHLQSLSIYLNELGSYIVKSLLVFYCLSYAISYISYMDDYHQRIDYCLYLFLSIINHAHSRYLHFAILKSLNCIDEKARIENKIQLKSQENNKVKFMQFVLHEVRVPLNSIVLGLDLLSNESELSEGISETIDMMKQSATFMVATLNDVLSWQKIEQGMVELELKPFSPSQLIHSVIASFRVSIEQKNMKISVVVDETVPSCVRGDFNRLQHVLANLMSNAIKFSHDSGNIQLHISVQQHDDVKMLRFGVRDEGIGINVEDQQSLFSPYMQIRPQDSQEGKGTGVGLSICKGIIKAHHGEIGCYSKDKLLCGSEFFFLIPLDVVDPSLCADDEHSRKSKGLTHVLFKDSSFPKPVEISDAIVQVDADQLEECDWPYKWWLARKTTQDTNARSTSWKNISCESVDSASTISLDNFSSLNGPPSAATASSFSFMGPVDSTQSSFVSTSVPQDCLLLAPINVLICDDVTTNRKMLQRAVNKKILLSECCCNGAEAVNAVITKGVDYYGLIFMDNIMPVMSGLEATKALRERGFHNLIVGVTGSAMDTETVAFAESGVDVVFVKPVHLEKIHRLLRNCSEISTRSPNYMDDPSQRELQLKALDALRIDR